MVSELSKIYANRLSKTISVNQTNVQFVNANKQVPCTISKWINNKIQESICESKSNFMVNPFLVFQFYFLKIKGFLVFSGGIKGEHWLEISLLEVDVSFFY